MEALQQLRGQLRQLFDSLFTIKDENGLAIHPIFDALPPKKEYPDYYIIIKKPVSFNTIKKRLSQYIDAQDFINDLAQIPWNAKTYNAQGSPIYRCATDLENFIKDSILPKLKQQYPNVRYPQLAPLPDEITPKENQRKPVEKPSSFVIKLNRGDHTTNTNTNNTRVPTILNTQTTNGPMQEVERKFVPPAPANATANVIIQNTTSSAGTPLSSRNTSQSPTPLTQTSMDPSYRQPSHLYSTRNTQKRNKIKRGRPPIIDLPLSLIHI